MSLAYTCRLCLSKSNLVWILAKRNKKVAQAIRITTGIEIRKGDISQNVCKSCCQLVMKFVQFKNLCKKSDKYWKAQLGKNVQGNKKPPPKTNNKIAASIDNNQSQAGNLPCNIHPSVTQICKTYPQMKLPSFCLKSHLLPYVSMQMNEVENYFKKRNSSITTYLQNSPIKSFLKINALQQTKTKIDLNITEPSLLSNPTHKKKSNTLKDSRPKKVKTNSCNCLTETESNTRKGVNVKNKNKNKSENAKLVIENRKKNNQECSKAKLLKTVEQKCKKRKVVLKDVSERWKEDVLKFIKDKAGSTIEENGVAQVKQSNENPVLLESLQMLPKATAYPLDTDSDALYHVTSLPLYVCNICNTTTDTIKALRTHKNVHKQCELCKSRFSSIENKIYHVENKCIYRQTVNIPATNLVEMEGTMEIYHSNEGNESFSVLKIENENDIVNSISSLSTESDLNEYLYQKSS